jgi:hypothetical protein
MAAPSVVDRFGWMTGFEPATSRATSSGSGRPAGGSARADDPTLDVRLAEGFRRVSYSYLGATCGHARWSAA